MIIEFVMDLHYLDVRRKLIKKFKEKKLVYINYLTPVNGLWTYLYPKPKWFSFKEMKSLSNFLRVMLNEVHGINGWRFYNCDLELIGSVLERIKYVVFDVYTIKIDVEGSMQLILHYDIYNGIFATNELENRLKFLIQYK
jgi:hypothetical protein